MPGCVTVHKENLKQRSKNKMLVNDDPKGNTTLCDSGMPSFQPVDYQSQGPYMDYSSTRRTRTRWYG
jgi:hypothetical protein